MRPADNLPVTRKQHTHLHPRQIHRSSTPPPGFLGPARPIQHRARHCLIRHLVTARRDRMASWRYPTIAPGGSVAWTTGETEIRNCPCTGILDSRRIPPARNAWDDLDPCARLLGRQPGVALAVSPVLSWETSIVLVREHAPTRSDILYGTVGLFRTPSPSRLLPEVRLTNLGARRVLSAPGRRHLAHCSSRGIDSLST